MTRGAKQALFLLPVVVLAALFFLRDRGPRVKAPEALDLVSEERRLQAAPPAVDLEPPAGQGARLADSDESSPYEFDLDDALRLRVQSTEDFEFERVWLQTALEPRWVPRVVLGGSEIPYLEAELPLRLRAPGHREYPVKTPIEFALLPVDAFTAIDLSGFGEELCMASGFSVDFGEAYTLPPHPQRFIHRREGMRLFLAFRRNLRKPNSKARLRCDFKLETACNWQFDFTWKPRPESRSTLDVAAKVNLSPREETTATVRLTAPFEFDPEDLEVRYAPDRQHPGFDRPPHVDSRLPKFSLEGWGELQIYRTPSPRIFSRSGDLWTLSHLTVEDVGCIVAGDKNGKGFGRWFGKITRDLELEIPLEPGVFMTGRLVEQGSKRPVRGGTVRLSYGGTGRVRIRSVNSSTPESWDRELPIATRADGGFRLSTVTPPTTDLRAPSRPSSRFWATFQAPFFEPTSLTKTDSGRWIDLGEITLTPKAPDVSLATDRRKRVPVGAQVILKREGLRDPKLCEVKASRLRDGRLDMDIAAFSLNLGTPHQEGPDEPSRAIERALIHTRNTPLFVDRTGTEYREVPAREIEIELNLRSQVEPGSHVNLSYNWDGLLVSAARLEGSDLSETVFLSRQVPDEALEMFLSRDDDTELQRIRVPKTQSLVRFER